MGTDLAPHGTRVGHRFVKAVEWAAELHAGQARKGKPTVPYLSHPLGVASLVLADGGNEDEAIAGLLHDVVEDCGVPPREVRWLFGNVVGDLFAGAADTLPDSAARGAGDWAERKRRYLAHLEEVDVPALRVSAADKLANARDIVADLRAEGAETLRRFNATPKEIRWYYESLVSVFQRRFPGRLTDELAATVEQLVAITSH